MSDTNVVIGISQKGAAPTTAAVEKLSKALEKIPEGKEVLITLRVMDDADIDAQIRRKLVPKTVAAVEQMRRDRDARNRARRSWARQEAADDAAAEDAVERARTSQARASNKSATAAYGAGSGTSAAIKRRMQGEAVWARQEAADDAAAEDAVERARTSQARASNKSATAAYGAGSGTSAAIKRRMQGEAVWARQEAADDAAGASAEEKARWSQSAKGNIAITRSMEDARKRELTVLREGIKGRLEEGKGLNAVGKLVQGLQRGGVRAGVAGFVSENLGGTLGAAAIGAFAGVAASSIVLPIAWAVGNAITGAVKTGIIERESSARFHAGSASLGGNTLSAGELQFRAYWGAQSSGGLDEARAAAESLQNIGLQDAEVVKRTNQLMFMSKGLGAGMRHQQYAAMMQFPTPESVQAMVSGNVSMEKEMIGMFRTQFGFDKLPESLQHDRLYSLIGKGIIGPKDVQTAMDRMSSRNSLGERRTEAGAYGLGGYFRGMWSMAQEDFANPVQAAVKNIPTMGARYLIEPFSPKRFGTPAGLGGEPNSEETSPNPIPVERRASWTSFSGLAESMQTMWSEPVMYIQSNTDAIQQSIQATKDLTAALTGSRDAAKPGDVERAVRGSGDVSWSDLWKSVVPLNLGW